MEKECLKCGESKPHNKFRPANGNPDGKNHYCTDCHAAYPSSELIFIGDKLCRKCNEIKPRTEYGSTSKPWGLFLQSYCKQCARQAFSRSRIEYKQAIVNKSPLKMCLKCGHEKPILTFPANVGNRDGKSHFCWDCKESYSWDELITLGTKVCTYCKEDKPRTEFEIRRANQELNTMCKKCVPVYRKARYDANPEKFRLQSSINQRKYWQLYPERLRERARLAQKTPRQRQLRLLSQRRTVASMTDSYILYLLNRQTAIDKKSLQSMDGIEEIIEAHRAILKLKRAVRS